MVFFKKFSTHCFLGHERSPQATKNVCFATRTEATTRAAVQGAVSSPAENPKGRWCLLPSSAAHTRARSPRRRAGRDGEAEPRGSAASPGPRGSWCRQPGSTGLLAARHRDTESQSRLPPASFPGATGTFLRMVFRMVVLAELQTMSKDFHKLSLTNLFLCC